MNRLGLFTGSGVVGAAVVPFLVVVMAIATGGDIFSAGPLNADQGPSPIGGAWSHADLACSDCHTPFWSPTLMGDRCLDCHTNVAEELATPASLHAGIASPATCRQCHPEHRGGHASLTLYAPNLYPHAEFGFYLIGHLSHADGRTFACSDCHIDTTQAFSQQTCSACHQDLDATWMATHELDFGFDCLACHDGIDSYGERFEHQATAFPLEGLHVDLACSTCHAGASDLADLRATPTDCVACHASDDAHQGSLGADCAACHGAQGWQSAVIDHDLTGFPLAGKHLAAACEVCHVDGQLSGIPTTCIDCHRSDDTHAGKFGTDCGACHTAEDWSTIVDGDFDHRLTGFALTGAHAQVATCSGCHAGGRFTGTPTDCAGCHASEDAHDGTFGTNCSACHSTSAWTPADFDHSQTGFTLVGGHAGVACDRCHAGDQFQGTPTTCVACHASDDAHAGAFGTDCGSCHDPSAWANAVFDHGRTTFALTGSHTTAACNLCHTNGSFRGTPTTCVACHESDDAHNGAFGDQCGSCHDTRAWGNATVDHSRTAFPLTGRHQGVACATCHVDGVYRGTPATCVACHASDDAHNGQFGSNCASCHTTSGWAGATFNHNSTAFPLTGRHTNATCVQCHANGVYDGTPTSCAACHASDDAHNGQFGSNCGSCHSTNGWAGATFNHNSTAFPLTGRHTSAACTQCHSGGVYDGTPTSCAACHGAPSSHPGFYGSDCTSCHNTADWSVRYGGSHTFPTSHHGAGGRCTTCHTDSFNDYTCYNCHDPARTQQHHEGVSDLSNCVACHPDGRKD